MSVVATVENGKIVESASQSSLSKTTSTSSDSMDKDAFLQLLVAQMKYQDPLEPTSNTEYISQYAQFSQVEQMQNMAQSMDLQRASSLVGQEVYIKTTDSTGNTNYVQGKVDYVVYENSKAYLAINESLYSIDDLDTVVDSEYLSAYDKATDFATAMNKLPNVKQVDLTSADKIDELESTYNGMTDYEKSFVASDYVTSLEKYVEKIKELRQAAEEAAKKAEEEAADNTEETEETEGTEGSEE
jgi:flagellar basal-body rod modification protein FlgD